MPTDPRPAPTRVRRRLTGQPGQPLVDPVLRWYADHARSLPWRDAAAGPWAVMVSEFMLQQTPVSRVLPVYHEWLARWPNPAALAAEPAGAAIRMWGRLGYPRRALRLHAAATAIVGRHGGVVPGALAELRALPGVGEYTAAAVASFAFHQRHAVLDTNVRRVLARVLAGQPFPASSVTVAERRAAESLLPTDPARAARFGVGLMELGALVCRASTPDCDRCPVEESCAWRRAGYPADGGQARRPQAYAGTDRQARGRLLRVLRASTCPVAETTLVASWTDDSQAARALASLVADGLVERLGPAGLFRLPGEHEAASQPAPDNDRAS